jgi:hypothetical protein
MRMVGLFRLLQLLTRRGRREARAAVFDRSADQSAALKVYYGRMVGSATLMGCGPHVTDKIRASFNEAWTAETTARKQAAAIRKGER